MAGREAGPAIEVKSPAKFVGQSGSLELFVDAPAGRLTALTAVLTQGDQIDSDLLARRRVGRAPMPRRRSSRRRRIGCG